MTDWVKTSFEIIEKVPSAAWRWAIVFLALGGSLYASIWLKFIPASAFDGYVQQAVPVMITVGVGLALIGIVFSAAKIPGWVASCFHSREETNRLLDNVRFAPTNSLPLLLLALQQPHGRIPSPGRIPSVRRLVDLELMAPVDDPLRFLDEGNILTLAAPVFRSRRRLIRSIQKHLSQTQGGADYKDQANIDRLFASIVTREKQEIGRRV